MAWIPLPIGIDNFEKVVKGGYYFVDKTMFIRELLDMKGEVNLFTRPRRFGKTLKISGAYGEISGDQYIPEVNEAVFV